MTHHLISNINNLTLQSYEYTDTYQIHVGNVIGWPIHHIGASQFLSSSKS